MIEQLYPGTRRLVFVDSRRRVEELGHRLAQRGVEVYLSHSSLALSEHAAAEKDFEEGQNCVIVATSALELGIDVGDLDRVIQIDAPSTVSSFLQRMGRAGTTANCTLLGTDEAAVLQAATLVDLFQQGFVEPAGPSNWAPHVLAHQAIALAMQEQGVGAHDWWGWLEGCAAFRKIAAAERESTIRHMLAQGILVGEGARLSLGAHRLAERARQQDGLAKPPRIRTDLGRLHRAAAALPVDCDHAPGPASEDEARSRALLVLQEEGVDDADLLAPVHDLQHSRAGEDGIELEEVASPVEAGVSGGGPSPVGRGIGYSRSSSSSVWAIGWRRRTPV